MQGRTEWTKYVYNPTYIVKAGNIYLGMVNFS